MNPQMPSVSSSGALQSDGDMAQLPPIHAPATFRPPDVQMPHFAAASAEMQPTPAPTIVQPAALASASQPGQDSSLIGAAPVSVPTQAIAGVQALGLVQAAPAAPAEEPDTALDEEWVGKARQVVGQLHTDPFLESKELSKLKAQYIKARYNKDIKVSEG